MPLILTRLAADGLSPMMKVRWPMASNSGWQRAIAELSAGRDDKELGRRGGFGPAEHRRGDIDLASFAMGLGEPIGERDADRAHRDMDGVLAKRREPAAVSKHNSFDRRVLGEHGDDDRVAPRLGQAPGDLRAIGRQSLGLVARPVESGHAMARFEKVPRHRRTHIAEPDKTDVHASLPHKARWPSTNQQQAACETPAILLTHPGLARSARY